MYIVLQFAFSTSNDIICLLAFNIPTTSHSSTSNFRIQKSITYIKALLFGIHVEVTVFCYRKFCIVRKIIYNLRGCLKLQFQILFRYMRSMCRNVCMYFDITNELVSNIEFAINIEIEKYFTCCALMKKKEQIQFLYFVFLNFYELLIKSLIL